MSSSYIFNSVGDVAVMGFLILINFVDVLSGALFLLKWDKREWYQENIKRMWFFPPWWVFPIVWTVIRLLIIISLYMFYRTVTLTDAYGKTVDAVTLLFFFNMALNLLWTPVFFQLHRPIVAWFICAGIVATGVAILYFFGTDEYWNSCWTFLIYVIWSGIALVLNTVWVWREKKAKKKEQELVAQGMGSEVL